METHWDKISIQYCLPPANTGVVERMNSVIEQCMRCTIHESGNINEWEKNSFYCGVSD